MNEVQKVIYMFKKTARLSVRGGYVSERVVALKVWDKNSERDRQNDKHMPCWFLDTP